MGSLFSLAHRGIVIYIQIFESEGFEQGTSAK